MSQHKELGALLSPGKDLWTGKLWAYLVFFFTLAAFFRCVVNVVYDLWFHPLARFPGPKFAAISNIPYSYWFLGGRQPYRILELHTRYGPVVRIAPNEVSFNSAQSWQDIYGFRRQHKTFIKSDFYDGGSFAARGVHSIVSERDVDQHAQMRRYLSHAFSERSLGEQEALISKTIDKFTESLGARTAGPAGYDIGKGYEVMTFDIIGDLAFGETFGGVESDEHHRWVSITLGALTKGALADVLKRFPLSGKAVAVAMHRQIKQLTQDTTANEELAISLVTRRLEKEPSSRQDFMTRIIEQRSAAVSDLQLAAHASDFVLAGSETTASALAAITFYLLRTPSALQRLAGEVRGSFARYAEINDKSTQRLKYLRAVILEGLRLYPPLPFPLPRVVPDGGDTVDGRFLPSGTIVSINPLAASLDPKNFTEPMNFRPERWIGNNTADTLDATQPFSLGPRGCLGRSLGWMELRTTLSKIIWLYDLEMVSDSLDWHRDSRMHTLWRKPKLFVKARVRSL